MAKKNNNFLLGCILVGVSAGAIILGNKLIEKSIDNISVGIKNDAKKCKEAFNKMTGKENTSTELDKEDPFEVEWTD